MTTSTVEPQVSPRPSIRERWNNLSRPAQWAILVPLVAVIYLLPWLNPPLLATTGTDFANAMFEVARYALVAVGLNVVVGQAGLLDLGYVGFFAVGAYVSALFTSPDSMLSKIPYLWTLPLAMVITMIFGVILGTPTLRLRGDYLAIVTLGFGEIIRLIADNVGPLRGQSGFFAVGKNTDGASILPNASAWYVLTVTIIVIILLFVGNLERSRVGRAWVAIREDEDAAEIMGVPTYRFKIWAFVIGAAIGGLSGALFAGKQGFVNTQSFDIVTSMLFLAAVVLGGAGNKVGVLLGAVVVAYLPLRFVELQKYNYVIFGIALIVLMIFRPQGILGARQRLLARGREAYQRLLGKGEQISGDSALTPEPNAGGKA
jgi:branched-chain amino acid transport system permease protein